MFAYCNNRPTVFSDDSGNRPVVGDNPNTETKVQRKQALTSMKATGYRSPTEAAKAFAKQMYSTSQYIRAEFGAAIYSYQSGNTTRYNYSTPCTGSDPHHASGISKDSIPVYGTRVAYVHTHSNSNSFSKEDIKIADNNNIAAYVIGPNRVLQIYTPRQGTVEIGLIDPIPLPEVSLPRMQSQYEEMWNAHIETPCGFQCQNKVWPNP